MRVPEYTPINFRVIFETPAELDVFEGRPVAVGTTILGVVRHLLRMAPRASKADDELLFGMEAHGNSQAQRGKVIALNLRFEGLPESFLRTAIDRQTGSAMEGSLHRLVTVPAGAMVVGSILVHPSVSKSQLALIRSAILNISRLGRRTLSGWGVCYTEILNFQAVGSVFISYSSEDFEHNSWVGSLADRLTIEGMSIIYDNYDIKPGDNLHVYMEHSIDCADKVLLILTPTYKEKATSRRGGVGFEFGLITSELFETLAENQKFLPVLRKGTRVESVPKLLLPYIYCDMSDDRIFESKFTELYGAIFGHAPRKRPKSKIIVK